MGSSGGGGSSGAISYPQAMENTLTQWLNYTTVDAIDKSMATLMNEAVGNSPFTGETAYDPDVEIAAFIAQLADFNAKVDLLSSGTGLDTLISNVLDESRIDDAVDEYTADFDAQLTTDVYPRFETGMRDINAVVSSAFVIGRANIEEGRGREVGKFSAALHMKAFGDDAIQVIGMKLEYEKAVAHATAEMNRLKITAKKEETDKQLDIDDADAKWDMETFQYGGNLMASIAGGTAQPGIGAEKGQKPSALGGALSGAATGAMVGGMTGSGWGLIIGAVVGGVGGYLAAA